MRRLPVVLSVVLSGVLPVSMFVVLDMCWLPAAVASLFAGRFVLELELVSGSPRL